MKKFFNLRTSFFVRPLFCIIVFWQIGCVSRVVQLSSQSQGSHSVSDESQGLPRSIVSRRFSEFVGNSDVPGSASSVGYVGAAKMKAEPTLGEASFLLLARSERWAELVQETNELWKSCLSSVSNAAEICKDVGRARALAHVRMGQPLLAWKIYDQLALTGVSSLDALLFAGLYFDVGSPELCANLSMAGLSWEPAHLRLELSALRAKCLRRVGDLSSARQFINFALREFPQESSLLIESALISFGENNLTQGCDILERLYLQRIRQVAVSYHWGECLIQRRDSEAASEVLSRAKADWPSERVWIILSGEIAYLEGRVEDARQLGFDYLASADSHDTFRSQAERLIRVVSGEK